MSKNANFLISATITLIALGAGFSASAQNISTANLVSATAQTAAQGDCASQPWPAFDHDCLQTMDGEPLDRPFRVIAAY